MNTTRYYYSNAEQQPVGPLGRRELDALIQAGVLLPESPILVEGETEWSTVSKLSSSTHSAGTWTPPPLIRTEAVSIPATSSSNTPDVVSGALIILWVILGLGFLIWVLRFFSWVGFVTVLPILIVVGLLKAIPQLLSQRRREARRQKQ